MDATFYNVLGASGLIEPSQLDYARRLAKHRLQSEGKSFENDLTERFLADILIEQRILTRYQADQLCSGRTKLTLGPYIITDWIGQGGMGQVYKAVHQVMRREVAVKVLPLQKATPETLLSFQREIRMQAQLDCPHLVRAYDAGKDGRVHYLVSEYVPGMDLRKLVKLKGPLPIHQAASIIMQAAIGLQHAHEQGMIHRDVKPGNILVTPEGLAKVSDVGLAGFASDLSDDPRAGKIVGTADYLSPEQIRTPLMIDAVSDIYSLGCTLYYGICGKVPFPGGDTQSKIRRHLSETPWHPRKFQPNLNEEFVDIIADLMEKNPAERIQSAAEVAARLEPWAGEARSISEVRLSRGPWMAPPPPLLDIVTDTYEANEIDEAARDGSRSISNPRASTQEDTESQTNASETPLSTALDRRENQSPPILDLQSQESFGASSNEGQINRVFTSLMPATNWKQSRLIIAMTFAIIVPPSLLIGAIIGFLFAHSQR